MISMVLFRTLIRVDAARALLSTSFGGSRRRVFTALPVRVSAECVFNARDQIGGQRARRRPRRRALLWLRFASSSERRVYSASRRLHPSPSLNSQSIRGRAPSPRRAAVNTPQYTAARHALLLGKFSARTRKRRASFPEAKETKKKRNAAPRRRLRRRSLRRAVSGSALPGRVPGTRLLARRHQPLPRHLGPSSRTSPRSAPDRSRRSRRR